MRAVHRMFRRSVVLAQFSAIAACDDTPHVTVTSALEQASVSGRVTDVAGKPLANLQVVADGSSTFTDAHGHFSLKIASDREVRVAVESDTYSAPALPVKSAGAVANVELAVKERRVLTLSNAAAGGRIGADDGFAVTVPSAALQDGDGKSVAGAVEIRYALINHADDVVAVPGRMQATSQQGLDGFGFADVRFFQAGKRLKLAAPVRLELPLFEGHSLKEGDSVDAYALAADDMRWRGADRGTVRSNKMVIDADHDEWLGAALETPVLGCVKGQLGRDLQSFSAIANTTLRAARARGLSLVQAETQDDGSFCLPVSPDDDWRVSSYYEAAGLSYHLDVSLDSSNALGMCGGDGCKDVGAVALPPLE